MAVEAPPADDYVAKPADRCKIQPNNRLRGYLLFGTRLVAV
ncbi:MAG TPA: hypothetical protein VGD55_14530 [Acidothermaceae bacterium]